MLDNQTGIYNITSYAQVHSYTATKELYIVSRLFIGDAANPAAGNGAYYARYSLNGQVREDFNSIGAGLTRTFIQSHGIKMDAGDVFVVSVKGLAGDAAVRVASAIGDITPSMSALFSGGGGGVSVWTEEEKKKAISDLSKILSNVKKILSSDDHKKISEAIESVRGSISSMSLVLKEIIGSQAGTRESVFLSAEKILKNFADLKTERIEESAQFKLDFISEVSLILEKSKKEHNFLTNQDINKNIIDKLKNLNDSISIIENIVIKSASTEVLEEASK